jgi:hypothetical protein
MCQKHRIIKIHRTVMFTGTAKAISQRDSVRRPLKWCHAASGVSILDGERLQPRLAAQAAGFIEREGRVIMDQQHDWLQLV